MSSNNYLYGVIKFLIKLCQVRYECGRAIVVAPSTIIPHLKKYIEPYLYDLLQTNYIELWTADALDSVYCKRSLTDSFQERISA